MEYIPLKNKFSYISIVLELNLFSFDLNRRLTILFTTGVGESLLKKIGMMKSNSNFLWGEPEKNFNREEEKVGKIYFFLFELIHPPTSLSVLRYFLVLAYDLIKLKLAASRFLESQFQFRFSAAKLLAVSEPKSTSKTFVGEMIILIWIKRIRISQHPSTWLCPLNLF